MRWTIPRGGRRGGDPAIKDGNDDEDEKDDDKEDVLDMMGVLPPLVAVESSVSYVSIWRDRG